MDFNVNQMVEVKLTKEGLNILREEAEKYNLAFQKPETSSGGWSRWQLWQVMNKFGHAMGIENPRPPFENDIRILE